MTRYPETDALLAVMEDDEDEARRLLAEMLPEERRRLADHLDRLNGLIDDRQRCRHFEEMVGGNGRAGAYTYIGVQAWHITCLDAVRAIRAVVDER